MVDEKEQNDEPKNSTNKETSGAHGSLVFISHDTRDAKLAEAFSSLLKSVSAGVLKSFRTSDRKGNQGIEYGVEWYPEIIKHIQEASDVVCLLTERSVDRPWILFEAGMAKGKLETPILGIALGISLNDASSGPFAQFQNCDDDEESLTKLVFQLVDRIPNSEPDEDTIRFQVGKFKEAISQILKSEKKSSRSKDVVDESPNDSSAKLFEEIKVMFQDLPSRIENNIDPDYRMRKKRRFNPVMIDEMIHSSKNPKTGIFIALGFIREPLPWLYEAGLETMRKIESKASAKAKRDSFQDFQELALMSSRRMFGREIIHTKQDMILMEEVPHMLMQSMERYMESGIK